MGNIFRQAVARAADTDACHWPCAPWSSLPLYLPSSGAAPAVSITTSFTPIVSALLGCNPDYIHHNELRVFTAAIWQRRRVSTRRPRSSVEVTTDRDFSLD